MIAHRGKFVAYYRVSTSQQGKSGLGLAAQKAAVRQRLDGGKWQLVGEFTEIESGKRVRRPQLEAALAACKKHRAKLIVAKLDRLARNTRFLLTLIEAGVDPLFCDLPEMSGAMGKFMLTSMAAVAELEAGLISERTKAGLAVARQRGKKLGATGAWLAKRHHAEAQARANKLAPVIRELRERGLSMRAIAAELQKRKVPTPQGGTWHPETVNRVVRRIEAAMP